MCTYDSGRALSSVKGLGYFHGKSNTLYHKAKGRRLCSSVWNVNLFAIRNYAIFDWGQYRGYIYPIEESKIEGVGL